MPPPSKLAPPQVLGTIAASWSALVRRVVLALLHGLVTCAALVTLVMVSLVVPRPDAVEVIRATAVYQHEWRGRLFYTLDASQCAGIST
ncbi:MAG: hypothetical protein ACKVVP_14075 [Chloroflexota bacterium]